MTTTGIANLCQRAPGGLRRLLRIRVAIGPAIVESRAHWSERLYDAAIPLAEYIQVLTTAGSEQEAERIAAALVADRLAACAQVVGPIASTYRWRGAVEREREWQCLAKTEAGRFEAVAAAIRALHSYEVPEILAIPVLAGSPGYLAWISDSVGD